MSVWLVRAGKNGEHEQRFFDSNRIYMTWRELESSLGGLSDKSALRQMLQSLYPSASTALVSNWTGQIGAFLFSMKKGDLVVVPRKTKAAFAVGEIQGSYSYDGSADMPYRHYRPVKWLNVDVPRSNFDQDLLFSLGAIQTICGIKKARAEERIRAYASGTVPPPKNGDTDEPGEEAVDLEQLGRDQIATFIIQKFKGHGMARLVEAVLVAQGYATFKSPPGPDRGVDILAAPGPLGFGRPRICVQVKSQESPVDSPTLNQLIGTMQNVQADQGLLVSWGGFKTSVDKEAATQFFRVRLWDQRALIDQLLEHYDRLDEDLRAELPLKRVWTVASQDEEE
jgi:restriction system protein